MSKIIYHSLKSKVFVFVLKNIKFFSLFRREFFFPILYATSVVPNLGEILPNE